MNIVVLDGYTLNPGDLDWTCLRALGTCAIHDRTLPDELMQRAASADILLTNKVVLSRHTIGLLPRLRYIGVLATGVNVVDTGAARERSIPVTNVPAYSTASVAQLTFGLILELAHRTGLHSESVHSGGWSASPDFCYWKSPLVELQGRTLGLVGLGNIGQAVARIGNALGMRVMTATRRELPPGLTGVERIGMRHLFERSDVLSLHCPLTEETRGLVNAERLGWMKPGAWLINTSRGPLVDEAELAASLLSGHLGGAGLDVLSVEPPAPDHPLLGVPNCIITPHIAWATLSARRRLLSVAVDNVKAFLTGRPMNVVNV